MSADKTPLISKLMLIVLVLILGCLVILIAQQNQRRPPEREASPEMASQFEEVSPEGGFARPDYVPITNRAIARRTAANLARPGLGGVQQPAAVEVASAPPPAVEVQFDTPKPVNVGRIGPPLPPFVGGGVAVLTRVSGQVRLTGKPPAEIPIEMGAACGQPPLKPLTTRHYLVGPDGGLANVFVYVKDGLQNFSFPTSTNQPLLDNTGCVFEPYVMGVQAGQKFKIKNSDPVLHNVQATPTANQGFNLALRPNDRMVERSFALPEVLVRLKCDVHPWMFAYIGVLSHPFFAVTDAQGAFRFPAGLPPGKYVIAAYHPKAGESTQEVMIGGPETKSLEFSLAAPRNH